MEKRNALFSCLFSSDVVGNCWGSAASSLRFLHFFYLFFFLQINMFTVYYLFQHIYKSEFVCFLIVGSKCQHLFCRRKRRFLEWKRWGFVLSHHAWRRFFRAPPTATQRDENVWTYSIYWDCVTVCSKQQMSVGKAGRCRGNRTAVIVVTKAECPDGTTICWLHTTVRCIKGGLGRLIWSYSSSQGETYGVKPGSA